MKKRPAHLVILGELKEFLPQDEDLAKKMEITRKELGDDSPWHGQWQHLVVTCITLFRLLRQIDIPQEAKPDIIKELQKLYRITSASGYKQQIEEMITELS
jgi:hypothetical protein